MARERTLHCALHVSLKNNSTEPDEESICLRVHGWKMLRQNRKLYFWLRCEVHSLTEAMRLWNQFDAVKRSWDFGACECWNFAEEHGCHFHVITNERFPIRKILVGDGGWSDRRARNNGCRSGGNGTILSNRGWVFKASTAVASVKLRTCEIIWTLKGSVTGTWKTVS